jgi:hypothetical protein
LSKSKKRKLLHCKDGRFCGRQDCTKDRTFHHEISSIVRPRSDRIMSPTSVAGETAHSENET